MILPRNVQLPRAEDALNLVARQIFYDNRRCRSYDSRGRCRSTNWSRWGRWVLAGILIFLAVVLVFLILCFRQRRMRKSRYATSTPMTAPANTGYNQGYNSQQYAPPPGAPPQYGNEGYNGYYGQQNGVAPPQNAYVK